MSKYAFLLGRKPLISLAELQAVMPDDTAFLELIGETLIIETSATFTQEEARLFFNRLGGSMKMIEITEVTDHNLNKLTKTLAQMAVTRFKGQEGKAKYAVFVKTIKTDSAKMLKTSLMELKKTLKEEGISGRFINNNFQNAEVAALKGENVLNRGAEFCALEGSSGWYLGHTLAIQDIDAYSTRDYERPERDPRVGMLPPKLAQILINLTGETKLNEPTKDKYLYDPFCGLGTVLMEGLIMGLHVVGSDISSETLKKAHKNLEWHFVKTNISNKSRLFVKDATQLIPTEVPEPICAVVSETYLGPPMSQTPEQIKIEEIFTEIDHVLTRTMENLHELLPANACVVITLLTYRKNQGYGKTAYQTIDNFLDKIPELGYEIADIISPELIKKFNLPSASQKTLLYERPEQTVCRGIYKFRKA